MIPPLPPIRKKDNIKTQKSSGRAKSVCITTSTLLLLIQFCFVLFSVQKCSSFSCYSLIWSIKTLVSHCQDFSYINNGFLALCVYIYNVFFSPVNEILSVTFDPNFLQMEDNPGT